MKIARHSFVPPIKDVTAASQRVNSKWGLALPSTVRSHNDLYFPCFLPPPLPSPASLHPLSSSTSLSSVSLYSLRQAPRDGCVLTGLSHSDATRGMLMCPRLCGGITPCDGTSAPALSRIHRSARCGKKIRASTAAERRIPQQRTLQSLQSCDAFVSQHWG